MRIVLADDHPIFTSSLELLLNTIPDVEIVGIVHDGSELPTLLRKTLPDVVICDIHMPGLDGLSAAKMIRSEFSGVRVLILSMADDIDTVRAGIAAGISGFLSKKAKRPELEMALRQVASGQRYFGEHYQRQLLEDKDNLPTIDENKSMPGDLSKRETEVIRLIADGLSNQDIAQKLYISINTVESHRKNIYRKIGVTNTSGLVRYAIRNGLVPPL
jgi:DNA-binding NarL/FixJ family response regulator